MTVSASWAVAPGLDYETLYTVDGDGSFTLKGVFDAPPTSDVPWAFIKFEDTSLNTAAPLYVNWIWQNIDDPSISKLDNEEFDLTGGVSGDFNIWRKPNNGFWTSNAEAGSNWQLQVSWYNLGGQNGQELTNFAVAPEPVSTLLFLFGGAPLGAVLYRRRKGARS